MDVFTDREVIQRLKREGWVEKKGQGKGSHRKFWQPFRGMITVPKGDIAPGTYRNIAKLAGWI